MTTTSREPHVLVLGAGFGGLGSALSLAARGGCRVTVVEAGSRPGGKADIGEVDGVAFDTGPSLLTLPEIPDALFREAGTSLRDELEVIEPSPAFRYLWPDGMRLDIQRTLDETVDSVTAAFGAPAGREFRDFVLYARRIWEVAAPHFVMSDAPSFASLFKLGPKGMMILSKLDALKTMQQAIEQRVRTPALRDLFARFATYNGSDPRRAPATLNCIAWVEMGLGGFGLRGGMHALGTALERVAIRHGVSFEYGARATSVILDGGQARGLRLADGRTLHGDAVVANADVHHLVRDLMPTTRHGIRDDAEPSMSGWTAVARARRRRGDAARAAHTVLFPRVYRREFEDVFDRDRCPREPTVYFCAQEHAHGRVGWPDHEAVFLMANAPPEPEHGARPDAGFDVLQERVLERARGAGLLDADDELVWVRTPSDLARTYPGTRGTIYGASSNAKMAAFNRPANRVPRVPGLYLASGGAHPGGGVPLCVQSGRMAAKALAADLGLRGARAA